MPPIISSLWPLPIGVNASIAVKPVCRGSQTDFLVTIPGATTLTVDIYYNGESVSWDWLSVWAGNYPSYTASSNTTSTVTYDGSYTLPNPSKTGYIFQGWFTSDNVSKLFFINVLI